MAGCSGANWDEFANGMRSSTSHYNDPQPAPQQHPCSSSSECMHLQNGVCLIPSGQYRGTCMSVAQ